MDMISTEILIIGGGPGGYTAAIRLAQSGKQVLLVEQDNLGGVCLNRGCIPSKALIHAAHQLHQWKQAKWGLKVGEWSFDFTQTQSWKNGIVQRLSGGIASLLKGNKIDVIKGKARFIGSHEVEIENDNQKTNIGFESCIVATGSSPSEISGLMIDGNQIVSSDHMLSLTDIPRKLVVVGGGYIGVELGTAYAKFGSEVTIIEAGDQLLPSIEKQMVQIVKKRLIKQGIRILTKTQVIQAIPHDECVVVTARTEGVDSEIEADIVLVAVGRRANTAELGLEGIGIQLDTKGFIATNSQLQTFLPHIFAIGDVAGGILLAHKAAYDASIVSEVICGKQVQARYDRIPFVIFSDPEIAGIGLTEEEAERKGHVVKVGKFPFQANGRALSIDDSDGYVKVVADQESLDLLGVFIVGAEASNLIAEAVVAIEMGATVEDIALIIHAHPTLPEAFQEAAEAVMGRALHMLNLQ